MSLRVAYCRFRNSLQEYAYLCPFEFAKVGDKATVLSPSGEATVRIIRLSLNIPSIATKSLSSIKQRPMADQIKERKQEIISRLTAIEQNYQLADKFKLLAKRDPEARKLVAEYKRLCK